MDPEATGSAFIDSNFARKYKLPLELLDRPRSIIIVNGRLIKFEVVTDLVLSTLIINYHIDN